VSDAAPLGADDAEELVEVEDAEEVHFDHRFLVPRKHASERKEVLRDWYISKAKEKILPRVAHLARGLGVHFAQAKIVDNRFRWGSCTVKDNVNFNWRLIKAPMYVIDNVIVHELTHFIEPNHNKRFWNIVRTHSPNAEKAKEWNFSIMNLKN
jgi:predicted metal-dependent hydrolase